MFFLSSFSGLVPYLILTFLTLSFGSLRSDVVGCEVFAVDEGESVALVGIQLNEENQKEQVTETATSNPNLQFFATGEGKQFPISSDDLPHAPSCLKTFLRGPPNVDFLSFLR